MEMGKNVRVSVVLMAAFMMVATTMAIRENVPLALAMRQREFQVIQPVPEQARIQQQLGQMILEAVAGAKDNNGILRCIPQYNRCGPAMDGVPCCAPYTCTSDYFGRCA
ncbi:hypothetical protein BVRB_3g062260 [Beta vulgaris subsp. vulgaris]|nr:hypothetical protein BVRB_3g062260 [Beta vulgaris subsp. vulgaris]